MANIYTDFFINPPKDYRLTTLIMATPPLKTVYKDGEFFDPNGMVIEAIYSNALRKVLAESEYLYYSDTVNPQHEPPQLNTFMTNLSISYNEDNIFKSVDIPIIVQPILANIEITTMPDKTSYFYKEAIDPTGMEVTAVYSDGSTKIVTNYAVRPDVITTLGSTNFVVVYVEDSIAKTVEVPITVEPIVVDLPSQSNSLTYNGSSQSPSWNNFDANQLDISGTTSGVNATGYTATFTPRYGYSWADGSTSAKNVNWQIDRAKISTIPSQSGSLTYSGSSQSPSWNNYNSGQLSIGGRTSAVNAGSYTVQFTPTSNYMWNDGTTSAKSVSWTIGKATPTLSLSQTSVSLDNDTKTTTVTITTNSTGSISVSSSNTSIVTATIIDKIITITGIESGNATITVNLSADSNFNSQTTNVNISVKISIIPVGYTQLQYISNPQYNYLELKSVYNDTYKAYISKVVMDIIPPIKHRLSGYGYIWGVYFYKSPTLFNYALKFDDTNFILEYSYSTTYKGSISIPDNDIDKNSGHLIITINVPSQQNFSLQINNIIKTASGINWNNMMIAGNVNKSGFYTRIENSNASPNAYRSGFSVCSIKYYNNNDILYADYIPVRNSSGKIGLYNTVEKKFIIGIYSGIDFIAGPEV